MIKKNLGFSEAMERLRKIKKRLPHGAMRRLASELECDPSKVSNAMDGFVKDLDFLNELVVRAEGILAEVVAL